MKDGACNINPIDFIVYSFIKVKTIYLGYKSWDCVKSINKGL